MGAALCTFRLISQVASSDRVHGASASALCDCAVALFVDWAVCQRDLVPDPPHSAVCQGGKGQLALSLGRKRVLPSWE